MATPGFILHPAALDVEAQRALVDAVMAAAEAAPFYRPMTPWGKPMSVRQTAFGPLGWVSDAGGYRYADRHPITGRPWPKMPAALMALWARYADPHRPADSCLINWYQADAKMGLHVDTDEADLGAPVLGVSLGDTAIFRIGGPSLGDPTATVRLASGDVNLLTGAARRSYHGVDRVLAGSSRLVPGGGRLNLTLRRAGA